MRNFFLLAVGILSPGIIMAAIFSWTDPSGNLIYGDTPPLGVTAKELNPPKLTVLEGFAERYESSSKGTKAKESSGKQLSKKSAASVYKALNVIAPKQGQAIRANDGDVSIALSIAPKLRVGDKIVFNLDGQEVKQGTTKIVTLTNLDRGTHVLTVSIIDRSSNNLITSDKVEFSVLRATVANKKPFNPYDNDQSLSQ